MSHGKKESKIKIFKNFLSFLLARTIRSASCHNFLDNPRSDSVKRSSTGQQVNSGRINELSTNDLFENILYLNEILTSSRRSLNSIEKNNDRLSLDRFDYDIIARSSKTFEVI
jgi:hypothetical protein